VAALQLINRVVPDVLCFNEIEENEDAALEAFALSAGLPFLFAGEVSTAMAGGIRNACLSRWPQVTTRSLSSSEISADPSANETGRDIVNVRVEVRPGAEYVGVFSVHLKSGFEDADYLRREVEALRLSQAVTAYREEFPQDGLVVMGDFNEEVSSSALGDTFTSAPEGMPTSWHLGSDLAYPFTYNPFAALTNIALLSTDPRQEDSNYDATRIPSGRRIDYLLYEGLTLQADQVYNPCRDNSVDDDPPGEWVALQGSPAECSAAEAASDHRPVFADFSL
jgi:endonuclease/exonuclease/phosphatase family metal-dependent hydrolase